MMRDYSKISDQFWIGTTGKALRGDMPAQIVALYLLTSPHANMIGVFYCPPIYISHETGINLEAALKGLHRLYELGFCIHDEETDLLWVREMARFQISSELKPADNRVKDVQKQYRKIREGLIKQGFYERYRIAFHLDQLDADPSPFKGPPKALQSQKQEQEQGQEQGQGQDQCLDQKHEFVPSQEQDMSVDAPPTATPQPRVASLNGTRLPQDWVLPQEWRVWAVTERCDLTDADITLEAEKFTDYWHAEAGVKGRKANWQATWRNWIRNARGSSKRSGSGRRPVSEDFSSIDYGEERPI